VARLVLWGLEPGRDRPDIPLEGSPERCEARLAVEDACERLWVLERIRSDCADRRARIGSVLDGLARIGLPVPAYLSGPDGGYVLHADGCCWQLAPFVAGDPLPQPEYVDDPERGHSLGRFLADLRAAGPEIAAHGVQGFYHEPSFSLPDYAGSLMATLDARQPDTRRALAPAVEAMAPLFEAWAELPRTLCHGDFHPRNVIWRDQEVASVIDWEFAGLRPRLFDAANCLGCVAAEDPRALVRGLAPALLRTLRDADCLDPADMTLLPGLVLALRLGWLSEWLRRNDREMIDMEIRLMRLLANSLDTLLPAWKTVLGS
jgi:homoserine kinase type II